MAYQLAQVNVARLLAPIESPELTEFVANLDPVNATADAAPGFVWRLQTEEGNATSIAAFEWDTADSVGVIVNLTVWRDVESLETFVYSPAHRAVLKRRREWFVPMREAYLACWWIPEGMLPTTDDAELKIKLLRTHGPSPDVFTLRDRFTAPEDDVV